jgi:putative transposase
MSQDFIHKARGVSDFKCHLVLTTKYRRQVLTDLMLTRLEEIFKDLMEKWGGRLVEFNGERDTYIYYFSTLRKLSQETHKQPQNCI